MAGKSLPRYIVVLFKKKSCKKETIVLTFLWYEIDTKGCSVLGSAFINLCSAAFYEVDSYPLSKDAQGTAGPRAMIEGG